MNLSGEEDLGSSARLTMTIAASGNRRIVPMSSSSSSSSSSANTPLAHRPVSKSRSVLTRTGKPKTRNGCVTCKSRHVKCDEAKPACHRCLRLKLDCSYRSGRKKEKVSKTRETRSLLPKEPHVPSWISRLSQPPPIVQIRAGTGFSDELEGRYFRNYLENSASQIGGPFKSTLWERLIPQISEQVPFVRHAIIAIGSLRQVQAMPHDPKISRSLDLRYVFKQYGEALRGMREAIARGQHDMRKALISCLLVYCFEGLLGNQASAAVHASSGLSLLYNLAFHEGSTTPGQVKMMMNSHLLEEDILEAFVALDLQVLLFIDKRKPEIHQQVKELINRNLRNAWQPPKKLDDAKKSWWKIMRRNYHFNKSLRPIDIASTHSENSRKDWEGSASMRSTDLLLSAIEDDPVSLKEGQSCYLSDIVRWDVMSQPLFERIAGGQNENDKLGAAILQVQANMNYIMLAATFFKTETAYDVFLPEFNKIVKLSEFALPRLLSSAHESVSALFHFDLGVVAALFLVGSRCRLDDLRQRAIALLFSANYREGIWDAQSVANISKWLRSVECEDIEPGGTIPEEKRAFLTGISCDLYHKRASLQCSQRSKNGLISRDTVVTW